MVACMQPEPAQVEFDSMEASQSAGEAPPHCLLWCPIPFISWLFPPIGHMVRMIPAVGVTG